MSRAKALRELSDNSLIIARLVDEEVAADYKYRGTFYRRSSPLQFVAADRRAHIIEKATATWKGGAAQAIQDGRKALKTTIERIVEASPNLMTLPVCVRKVLVDVFSSEKVASMEATTHYPYSHASNNTAAALYTLIAVIYLDINGANALDRWVRRDIAPLLEDVASVPQIRKDILLSMDPTHGVLAVSIALPDGESKTTSEGDGDGGASTAMKRQPLKDLASQLS